ncbi:MAG: helix-turn-helix domain-containing protein [Coriobacteriia bacterium]|nr:helix-turn-helix domain-containing protein [Coriobacteriia bacterium]
MNARLADAPDLLTTGELAAIVRVSERTIRSWRARGLLPAVKIAGTVRYRREAVERALIEIEQADEAIV